MNKRTKRLLIVLGVVALAAAIYFFFFRSGSEPDLARSGGGDAETQIVEVEILTLLNKLRSIEFDASIFEDPHFQGLVDFSFDLVPQSTGRPNPFAPIGSDPAPEPAPSDAGSDSSTDAGDDSADLDGSFLDDEIPEFEFGEFEDF